MEELFELSQSQVASLGESTVTDPVVVKEALTTLERIDSALPQVRGLESTDNEMDGLAKLAEDSYRDLMALGFEVEPRFSSEVFNAAGAMLGHAITAKTAKIQKKLKMIELQLRKAVLDQKLADKNEVVDALPVGEGRTLSRNELLKAMNGKT